MIIQNRPIDEIRPYDKNPRKNNDAVDKVAASINEFGFRQPIVVDKDGFIIVGHTRYKAAQQLGLEEVPVVEALDLSEAQVKAYRLADNKTAEYSEWDIDLLGDELRDLEIADFDMRPYGFEDMSPEVEEDDFDVDQALEDIETPVTQSGDIWLLGRHRLLCGDSTDETMIQKLMDGRKADLFLTDPPYNVAIGVKYKEEAIRRHRRQDGLALMNDDMDDDSFILFLEKAFSCASNAMKAGAAYYIWHADQQGHNFRMACVHIGWQIRQCLVWVKDRITLTRQDYQWKHEPCLYGWKEGASHLWASDRKQSTILEFDRPTKSPEHPTMKPVRLFDYQIQNNTKAEDIVLDTFAGSGTTVVACEQNGRTAYCMELDPKYCDVIVKRFLAAGNDREDVFLLRREAKTPLSETGII